MAWAIIRYSREVLPAPVGWWVGGGDTSSRIVGEELAIRASSSGMLKGVFIVVAWLPSLLWSSIHWLLGLV